MALACFHQIVYEPLWWKGQLCLQRGPEAMYKQAVIRQVILEDRGPWQSPRHIQVQRCCTAPGTTSSTTVSTRPYCIRTAKQGSYEPSAEASNLDDTCSSVVALVCLGPCRDPFPMFSGGFYNSK